MKKLKNMKGITLIALVITIVVLLILAGVTIAMLTGDNGILTKATKAKSKTAEEEAREKVTLMLADWKMENAINRSVTLNDYLMEEEYEKNRNSFNVTNVEAEGTNYIATVNVGSNNLYEIEIDASNDKNPIIVGISLKGMRFSVQSKVNGYTFVNNGNIKIELTPELIQGDTISSIIGPGDETLEMVNNKIEYQVNENGEYKFKIVTTQGLEKEVIVHVNNFLEKPELQVTTSENLLSMNVISKYPTAANVKYEYYYKLNDGEWINNEGNNEIEGLSKGNIYILKVLAYIDGDKSNSKESDVITKDDSILAGSLLEGIAQVKESSYAKIRVNDENLNGKGLYNVDIIYCSGDLKLDGITQIQGSTLSDGIYEFGNANTDVATESKYAQNMVVLKVEGNLTIDQGVVLTACKSEEGYGGPKGILIYCTGNVINNGTISMTARGARAEGEDVYLWKNKNGTYEYVSAAGAAGGAGMDGPYANGADRKYYGINGGNGENRQTGGGGSRRGLSVGNGDNFYWKWNCWNIILRRDWTGELLVHIGIQERFV